MSAPNLPFALSLSKHVLSGCRRQAAEGGFDKLSPNGCAIGRTAR